MDFPEFLHKAYLILGDMAVVCLLINVGLCLFNFKKLALPFRRLTYFLLWNLFIECLARLFSNIPLNNLPLLHLYTLGEILLFSWFYQSIISKPVFFQKRFKQFVLAITLVIVCNSIFFQSIFEFNPFAKTLVQLIIIGFAILYFYNITDNQSLSPHLERSLRLINSAIIVYYSGSLFIFMCNQLFFNQSELYKVFWTFNSILNLGFQLLILWGIWKVVSNKIPLSS